MEKKPITENDFYGAIVVTVIVMFLLSLFVFIGGVAVGENRTERVAVNEGAAHWGSLNGSPKIVWHGDNYVQPSK